MTARVGHVVQLTSRQLFDEIQRLQTEIKRGFDAWHASISEQHRQDVGNFLQRSADGGDWHMFAVIAGKWRDKWSGLDNARALALELLALTQELQARERLEGEYKPPAYSGKIGRGREAKEHQPTRLERLYQD